MNTDSYAQAGVDIGRGERFVGFIKSLGSSAVSKAIGGFSSAVDIDLGRFRDPVLMTTTDGVGTKIMVARHLGRFDTIGIDLVAMCVNDLVVSGAVPVAFLDYIACGSIDEAILHDVMKGIVEGCERAGCALNGGETAELPGMYGAGDFDLAGFAVGIAERESMLPRPDRLREGDLIIGLPSVGVHSNGLSLARAAIPKEEGALWRELLSPTKIYVAEMTKLHRSGIVGAAAHVTGGGLAGNLARVLPEGLSARFNYRWEVPAIFDAIQHYGGVTDEEMRRVFNMGIGIALVVAASERQTLLDLAAREGFSVQIIGELIRG